MRKIKCITFDKEAQDNLPQDILDKMAADRDKARKEMDSKVLNIPCVTVPLPDSTKEMLQEIISWEKNLDEYEALETKLRRKYIISKRQ